MRKGHRMALWRSQDLNLRLLPPATLRTACLSVRQETRPSEALLNLEFCPEILTKQTVPRVLIHSSAPKELGRVNFVHFSVTAPEQIFLAGANRDCANPVANFYKFAALPPNPTLTIALVLILLERLPTKQNV